LDSLGNVRKTFSDTETLTLRITCNNDTAVDKIYYIFSIYDSKNTRLLYHDGNTTPGNTGTGYSELRNISIKQFSTTAGDYSFKGEASDGTSGDSRTTVFSVMHPWITLSYPSNNARNITDLPLTFRWTSSGASKFKVYVDDDANFFNTIWTGETTLNSIDYPLIPSNTLQRLAEGTVYWWKVEGYDSNNNLVAQVSMPFNFTVKGITPISHDLAINKIELDKLSTKDKAKINMEIKNQGNQPESNIPVDLFINGVQVLPGKIIPSIQAGDLRIVDYEVVLQIESKVAQVMGTLSLFDDNPRNNILSTTIDLSQLKEFKGYIRVNVTDSKTFNKLSDVTVKLDDIIIQEVDEGIYYSELKPGSYKLTASKTGYYDSTPLKVTVKKDETTEINLQLIRIETEFGIISGEITDEMTELPVEGATVKCISTIVKEILTDSSGKYVFKDLEPTGYKIVITHPLYEDSIPIKHSLQQGDELIYNVKLKRKITEQIGFISGEVESLEGRIAIAGAVGQFFNAVTGTSVKEATTDNDGEFLVELPVGTYKIIVKSKGYEDSQQKFEIKFAKKTDLKFKLKTKLEENIMKIFGVVINKETGKALANATVKIVRIKDGEAMKTVKTDDEGKYEVELPVGETYNIFVDYVGEENRIAKVTFSKEGVHKLELKSSVKKLSDSEIWEKTKNSLKDSIKMQMTPFETFNVNFKPGFNEDPNELINALSKKEATIIDAKVNIEGEGKKGVTKVTLELKIKTSTGKEKSLKFNFAGTRGKK